MLLCPVALGAAPADPANHAPSAQLLAIEVNGVQLSRGAWVVPQRDGSCWVQTGLLSTMVTPQHLEAATHDGQQFDRLISGGVPCRVEGTLALAQLVLPAAVLKQQGLQLGGLPPSPLLETTIPSLAIDLIASSGHAAWGLTASRALSQFQWRASASSAEWSFEQLTAAGGQLEVGHFTAIGGLLETPRRREGIRLTNRAPALRNQVAAHAELSLTSPARIRMLDAQGHQLYATNMLRPGRFLIEGFGASQHPGLMTIEVNGLDGQRQELLVPWVASPWLLGPGQQIWDIHAEASAIEFGLRRGLNLHETARFGGSHREDASTLHTGLATRRWPGIIGSAALGIDCNQGCAVESSAQLQWHPSRRSTVAADWRGQRENRGHGAVITHQMGEWGVVQLHLSKSREALRSLSWSRKIPLLSQFQLQLRDAPDRLGGRSLLATIVIPLDARRSIQTVSERRSQGGIGHQVSFRQRSAGLLGESIGLTKRSGPQPGYDLALRSERDAYDVQLNGRQHGSQPGQFGFQAASRLWLTGNGVALGRVGDQNLVIQNVGAPDIPVRQRGRTHRQSNASGLAFFPNVPPNGSADFEVDGRRLPINLHAQAASRQIATLSRRAYRIDTVTRVRSEESIRLPGAPLLENRIRRITDAAGRHVAHTEDGHLDWEEETTSPLRVEFDKGILLCDRSTGNAVLQCRPSPISPPPSSDWEATMQAPGQKPG